MYKLTDLIHRVFAMNVMILCGVPYRLIDGRAVRVRRR